MLPTGKLKAKGQKRSACEQHPEEAQPGCVTEHLDTHVTRSPAETCPTAAEGVPCRAPAPGTSQGWAPRHRRWWNCRETELSQPERLQQLPHHPCARAERRDRAVTRKYKPRSEPQTAPHPKARSLRRRRARTLRPALQRRTSPPLHGNAALGKDDTGPQHQRCRVYKGLKSYKAHPCSAVMQSEVCIRKKLGKFVIVKRNEHTPN